MEAVVVVTVTCLDRFVVDDVGRRVVVRMVPEVIGTVTVAVILGDFGRRVMRTDGSNSMLVTAVVLDLLVKLQEQRMSQRGDGDRRDKDHPPAFETSAMHARFS